MQTTPEIRVCTPDDCDAVVELAPRLAVGMPPWRPQDGVLSAIRGWLESSVNLESGALAYVAAVDSRIVGFVSVSATNHFSGERDAYIGELVVAEGFEDRGIGRLLVEAVEAKAAQAGFRCITLHTSSTNQRACAFYRRLGYQLEEVKLTRVLNNPRPDRQPSP